MRFLVVAGVLAFVLAGCSSSPDGDGAPAATSPSSTPSLLVFDEPPPRTDTLFLLDAPHMAATLPSLAEPLRMAIPTPYAAAYPDLAWKLPRPEMGTVTATFVAWVEVQGTVAHAPGCFWSLITRVETSTGWTGTSDCVPEPHIVPTGIRMVQFDVVFDTTGIEGDVLGFSLAADAVMSPGASVSILAGTVEYASQATIAGLQLPLDTETYL